MKTKYIYFQILSMKNTVRSLLLIFCFSLTISSCDEENFLKTEPVDFYSPSNSYITVADYEAATVNLYAQVRNNFFSSDLPNDFPSAAIQATEVC